MSRDWFLTPVAAQSLRDILHWTSETFGPRQADIYGETLIERCEDIAAGRASSRSCDGLAPTKPTEDMRYTRAGEHVIVFLEREGQPVTILDFVHSRANLPAHVARLSAKR